MTARTLPEGIVINSDVFTGDLDSIDRLAIEDISQLWKVYATKRSVVRDDIGLRLENFFWRIWSSERINQNLKGSTLSRLFTQLSGDSNIIHTTPTQSPKSNKGSPKSSTDISPQQDSHLYYEAPHEEQSELAGSSGACTTSLDTQSQSTPAKPPPILKKTVAKSQSHLPGITKVTSPAKDPGVEKHPTRAFIGSSRRPPAPSFSKSHTKSSEASRRKKTTYVVNTAGNRRRPLVSRRKSSQSSSSNVPIVNTSSGSSGEDNAATHPSETPVLPSKVSSGVSPIQSSMRQQKQITESSRSPSMGDTRADRSYSDWLVDRDFRSRFVDKNRQDTFAAFTTHPVVTKTLATVAPTPTAATGTVKLSELVVSNGKGKGRQFTIVDEVAPLRPEGSPSLTPADMDKEPGAPLPKTRSQLTMLLERDRRASDGATKFQGKQGSRKSSS
ncbi:MAG: hypothetical protein M1827_004542 [Pycnora praestabilis]|nr:MAG: hypothetical protein M1827_004542 [Pycnora praestabilis]